jgi:hypothetical protein
VFRVQPQVERQEREAEPLVLLDVPELMPPETIGRLEGEHDDVSECDRRVVPSGQDEVSETAVAHIDEAAIAEARAREREPAEEMSDRIGMVGNELAPEIIARRYRPPPAPPL